MALAQTRLDEVVAPLLPVLSPSVAERCGWSLSDAFECLMPPSYHLSSHIRDLHAHLEAVERGDILRLAVKMPPRHAKSTNCSQLFPAWWLGRRPSDEIILSSYSTDLARFQSRQCQRIVASPEYRQLFPNGGILRSGRASVDEWEVKGGGSVKAAGVGAGISGRGAHLGIIDDPFKDRAEANSAVIRESVHDWYKSTFYTRLAPDAAIVLVMASWHVDDMSERLLAASRDGSGEKWTVVLMPAIKADGTALWPERFTRERLEQTRIAIGSFEFDALYQQSPTAKGGNRFAVGEINWHDDEAEFPQDGQWFRFWDLASSTAERDGKSPDSTASFQGCVTRGPDGLPIFWARYGAGCQEEAPARDKTIKARAKLDAPSVRQGIESVAGYKDTYANLKAALMGVRTVMKVAVNRDKTVNAAEFEPVMEAGNVHILRDEWSERLLSELTAFPHGAHDDFANALWGAFQLARGPADHTRVYPQRVVDAMAGNGYDPPVWAEILIAISFSAPEGHRVVLAAKDGQRLYVYGCKTIFGGIGELAGAVAKMQADRVAKRVLFSALDGSHAPTVFGELYMAGVQCAPGADESHGHAALEQALIGGLIEIGCEAEPVAKAVEQFAHAPEGARSVVTGEQGGFSWAGDAGYVRALFDLAAYARTLAESKGAKPMTRVRQIQERIRAKRKPNADSEVW